MKFDSSILIASLAASAIAAPAPYPNYAAAKRYVVRYTFLSKPFDWPDYVIANDYRIPLEAKSSQFTSSRLFASCLARRSRLSANLTSFLAALLVAPAVVLEVPLEVPLAVQVALVTFLVASAAVLLVALAVPVPVLLEVLEDSVTFLVDLVVGLLVVTKVATPLLPPLLLPLAQRRLLQLVLLMAKLELLELPVPLVLQTVRLVLELREQLVSM